MFSTNSGSGTSIQHPLPLDTICWTNIGSKNIIITILGTPQNISLPVMDMFHVYPFVAPPEKLSGIFHYHPPRLGMTWPWFVTGDYPPSGPPGTSSSCDTFEGLASRTQRWNISDDWHWLARNSQLESNYPLVMTNKAIENHIFLICLIGKPSINGPFSIAMLVYQRVCIILSLRQLVMEKTSTWLCVAEHSHLNIGQQGTT